MNTPDPANPDYVHVERNPVTGHVSVVWRRYSPTEDSYLIVRCERVRDLIAGGRLAAEWADANGIEVKK